MPIAFLAEFAEAAGVFQMGEMWMREPEPCAKYQGALTSVFNYPLYEILREVWGP